MMGYPGNFRMREILWENAIFGTLTDSPLETSDSEDENISADTDKQTDDNTSTESRLH